jgi:integrase
MLNAGVAITTVSKMLGHSNSNITQKIYATLIDDTILNEVKKII